MEVVKDVLDDPELFQVLPRQAVLEIVAAERVWNGVLVLDVVLTGAVLGHNAQVLLSRLRVDDHVLALPLWNRLRDVLDVSAHLGDLLRHLDALLVRRKKQQAHLEAALARAADERVLLHLRIGHRELRLLVVHHLHMRRHVHAAWHWSLFAHGSCSVRSFNLLLLVLVHVVGLLLEGHSAVARGVGLRVLIRADKRSSSWAVAHRLWLLHHVYSGHVRHHAARTMA